MSKIASRNHIIMLFLMAIIFPGLMGCAVRISIGSMKWDLGPGQAPQSTYTPNPTYTLRPAFTPRPTYTPNPTYTLLSMQSATLEITSTPSEGEISQFATTATASSQYSQPNWSAMQAVGTPDTAVCGDYSTAWASQNSNSKDWLLLTYDQPVFPTRIIIYQTYHPGAVSLVEVIDEAGNAITVYEAVPSIISQCPFSLEVEVKDVKTLVRSVRVTINQSNHNGWNEIDAVQLFGEFK